MKACDGLGILGGTCLGEGLIPVPSTISKDSSVVWAAAAVGAASKRL